LFFITQQLMGQMEDKEDFYRYPLKTIISYCQKDPTIPISTTSLFYDSENRVSIVSDENGGKIKFKYNEYGLLISKVFINETEDVERTMTYEYDQDLKLIYEGYEDERPNNTIKEYYYNGSGQLIKMTLSCRNNVVEYTYEYNSKGQLMNEYKDNRLLVQYVYHGDLLVKKTSNNIETIYEYNINDQLLRVIENDKIIEENVFKNGKTIERWVNYYGIDPCFRACCSQYLLKYTYY